MDVFQTTRFTWLFIYGCALNYMIYLTIIYGSVPNYRIYLTIYLWVCFNFLALLDNLWKCSKLLDLIDNLSIDVFQSTWFTWPFSYGCVPNYMIYLTIYLWKCSKLHDFLDHFLWMCSKLHDLLDYFSMDVFQTTWFTWPFIYECVPNHMIYLTIYLWMCSKLHDLLDHYLWKYSKLLD